MGYKCSFLDNEVYTAQDVNDIFARVTWGGVLFADTGYVFGDLNGAAGHLSTEGVTRDPGSCRVVKENGVYKISKGACIMNDGSAIVFDEVGQEIEVPQKQTSYVYLSRNVVGNSIDIVVSAHPGDENSVPLAEIDYQGDIFDRRTYARAKVDMGTAGTMRNFSVHFTECTSTQSETVTVDFGDEVFSHIVIWDGEKVISNGSTQKRVASSRNLAALINGEEVCLPVGRYEGTADEYMHFTKDGQKLHIYLNRPSAHANYTMNLAVI